ncbi:helix-turn-helix domain-containing protein [Scytonema sp. PCC 10023]
MLHKVVQVRIYPTKEQQIQLVHWGVNSVRV